MSDGATTPMSVIAACIQTMPEFGRVEANLDRQIELVRSAAGEGAGLVVLPECSTTGYCFSTPAEASTLAEDVTEGGGAAISTWSTLCNELGIHLVAGLVELNGTRLFNTAVLVGPSGVLGRYRKTHLWGREREIFSPGDLGYPVYETPIGRIAMQICYDGWFPESARLAAIQGADVICVPANWVPVPTQDPSVPAMANMLCFTAAHTNLVYVAAASRVGVERNQPFIGRSVIVDHTGTALAGPGSSDTEQTVTARIDPIGSRSTRRHNPFNQPLRDRRLDLYGEALGSAHDPGDY